MESMMTRKFGWIAVVLLTATVAACGGSTQTTGTAPSLVAPVAASSETAGNLGLLKEGNGKGHLGTPPTVPEPGDAGAEEESGDIGEGHGHVKAAIQLEGFTDLIDGTCPELTININGIEVITVGPPELATEFQRADCETIAATPEGTPIHLHIAAKQQGDDLVAIYVRMQGPKGDDGDAGDEEEETTPTTTTPTE
jgi:hypothetical protein